MSLHKLRFDGFENNALSNFPHFVTFFFYLMFLTNLVKIACGWKNLQIGHRKLHADKSQRGLMIYSFTLILKLRLN